MLPGVSMPSEGQLPMICLLTLLLVPFVGEVSVVRLVHSHALRREDPNDADNADDINQLINQSINYSANKVEAGSLSSGTET